MTSPQHTRRIVLRAALEACPGLPAASGRSHRVWGPLARRMQELAKPDAAGAKRLATFGKVIGEKLDDPVQMAKVLDGDWMELFNQVLNAVVSAKTKQERLNCATCDPADFPVLLAVIQAIAYGAPERMWRPKDPEVAYVGRLDSEDRYNRGKEGEPTPESHHEIAARTWYRPQLAMLVTSIWPKTLGLEYYDSTLRHILQPGANVDTEPREILEGQTPGFEELGGLI